MPKYFRTSNANKLSEFRRFGLDLIAQHGPDLPEVLGTPEEVIIYKSLAAGDGVLVEDTSLDIDGCDAGINIRWLLDNVIEKMKADPASSARNAVWRVMVAYHEDGLLHIAGAEVSGTLTPVARGKGFSFDAYFVPNGQPYTLGELELMGKKDLYSARKMAAMQISDSSHRTIRVKDIPKWEGSYQHD